jgi:hypothetical protein
MISIHRIFPMTRLLRSTRLRDGMGVVRPVSTSLRRHYVVARPLIKLTYTE